MACPVCGSDKFYVKNPKDQYETYEFTWVNGNPVFDEEKPEFISPDNPEFEAYCNICIWHGKLKELK